MARPIHYLALALLLFVLSLLASRSIIIGLFVLTAIWFSIIRFSKKNLFFSGITLVLITLFCMSYQPIKNRFYEAVDSKDVVELDAPIEEHKTLGKTFGGRAIRMAVWFCSYDLVKENWLFGVGTGDAQNKLQESYKNHNFEFAYLYNRYNAHNLFIQTIISSGILGLMSIVSIFIFLVYISIKTKCIKSFAFSLLFILKCNQKSITF
jgi:O-antigen ligase